MSEVNPKCQSSNCENKTCNKKKNQTFEVPFHFQLYNTNAATINWSSIVSQFLITIDKNRFFEFPSDIIPPNFGGFAPKMSSIESFVISPNSHRLFQMVHFDLWSNSLQILCWFRNKKWRILTFLSQFAINSCLKNCGLINEKIGIFFKFWWPYN